MKGNVPEIEEILGSDSKPKEKMTRLAEVMKGNKDLMKRMMEAYPGMTVSERGHCVSALTIISKEDPKSLSVVLDFVLDCLDEQKAPRVKWEATEILGNVAAAFPEKVEGAVPKLMENTKDEGTVARWATATALTEIAKANPKTRVKLVPFFTKIAAKEENNAVRKIYEKALKALAK